MHAKDGEDNGNLMIYIYEERNVFWENLNDCLGGFGASVNVCLVGDLNARVGTDMEGGVVGLFGVGDRNLNGDSLIEVCMANRLQ